MSLGFDDLMPFWSSGTFIVGFEAVKCSLKAFSYFLLLFFFPSSFFLLIVEKILTMSRTNS